MAPAWAAYALLLTLLQIGISSSWLVSPSLFPPGLPRVLPRRGVAAFNPVPRPTVLGLQSLQILVPSIRSRRLPRLHSSSSSSPPNPSNFTSFDADDDGYATYEQYLYSIGDREYLSQLSRSGPPSRSSGPRDPTRPLKSKLQASTDEEVRAICQRLSLPRPRSWSKSLLIDSIVERAREMELEAYKQEEKTRKEYDAKREKSKPKKGPFKSEADLLLDNLFRQTVPLPGSGGRALAYIVADRQSLGSFQSPPRNSTSPAAASAVPEPTVYDARNECVGVMLLGDADGADDEALVKLADRMSSEAAPCAVLVPLNAGACGKELGRLAASARHLLAQDYGCASMGLFGVGRGASEALQLALGPRGAPRGRRLEDGHPFAGDRWLEADVPAWRGGRFAVCWRPNALPNFTHALQHDADDGSCDAENENGGVGDDPIRPAVLAITWAEDEAAAVRPSSSELLAHLKKADDDGLLEDHFVDVVNGDSRNAVNEATVTEDDTAIILTTAWISTFGRTIMPTRGLKASDPNSRKVDKNDVYGDDDWFEDDKETDDTKVYTEEDLTEEDLSPEELESREPTMPEEKNT